jgi:hypothetical protein
VSADYVASFIGWARFFLEANRQMPRTFGRNQVHVSQVVGWLEADYPLVEVAPAPPNDIDHRIAAFVAERSLPSLIRIIATSCASTPTGSASFRTKFPVRRATAGAS